MPTAKRLVTCSLKNILKLLDALCLNRSQFFFSFRWAKSILKIASITLLRMRFWADPINRWVSCATSLFLLVSPSYRQYHHLKLVNRLLQGIRLYQVHRQNSTLPVSPAAIRLTLKLLLCFAVVTVESLWFPLYARAYLVPASLILFFSISRRNISLIAAG